MSQVLQSQVFPLRLSTLFMARPWESDFLIALYKAKSCFCLLQGKKRTSIEIDLKKNCSEFIQSDVKLWLKQNYLCCNALWIRTIKGKWPSEWYPSEFLLPSPMDQCKKIICERQERNWGQLHKKHAKERAWKGERTQKMTAFLDLTTIWWALLESCLTLILILRKAASFCSVFRAMPRNRYKPFSGIWNIVWFSNSSSNSNYFSHLGQLLHFSLSSVSISLSLKL